MECPSMRKGLVFLCHQAPRLVQLGGVLLRERRRRCSVPLSGPSWPRVTQGQS